MMVTTVRSSQGTPAVMGGQCSRVSRRASFSLHRNTMNHSIFSRSPGKPTSAQSPVNSANKHQDSWNGDALHRSTRNHRIEPSFCEQPIPIRLSSQSEAAIDAGARVYPRATLAASPANTEDDGSSGEVWSAFFRLGQRPRQRQQQQYHHLLRTRTGFVTGLWRSLFQQQLVLVLTLVLVFSGIESVVHCDEIVSNGSGRGGDGSDRVLLNRGNLLDGVVQVLTTSKGSYRGSGSVPASTDQFTSNNNNELDDELDGGRHFTHHWAVHIPDGDQEQLAERVAAEHGFINRGKRSSIASQNLQADCNNCSVRVLSANPFIALVWPGVGFIVQNLIIIWYCSREREDAGALRHPDSTIAIVASMMRFYADERDRSGSTRFRN
ncbi:hypothetical protein AND_009676 [Anopheles darlingi]|uniref:Peptidase S8 pro-domain domain-containing protein n=1 Tax=Anopheles darlingi TaxID=43151 RepID=W5J4A3_ANODA|nr:hypothetical protein AND_009676 [Anopheles darlingi]